MLPGFLVGALALQIRGDLDASVEAVAAGVSVFFLAGAFGAGPGGRLSERTGALRAMTRQRAGDAVPACCSAGWSRARSSFCFACLVVAGLANAVAQPAINLFMADQVPPERQGLAFGIKQSAIPAAVLISGLALPRAGDPARLARHVRDLRARAARGGAPAGRGRGPRCVRCRSVSGRRALRVR